MPSTRSLSIAAAVLAGVAPAAAEVHFHVGPRMSLHEGDGATCFATVEVVNGFGQYNATETLETDRGPVEIKYTTVGGHNGSDDDLVEVMSTPLGVSAEPSFMAVPDDDTLTICLYETPTG